MSSLLPQGLLHPTGHHTKVGVTYSGFIIVLTPVPLLPGKSLQPGSLAGTCCLLVGASIAPYLHSVSLCQAQTTEELDASQGQPESLHPTARVARQSLVYYPCPTVGCTQAKEELRDTLACHAGESKRGDIKAKITWSHSSSQLTQFSLPR